MQGALHTYEDEVCMLGIAFYCCARTCSDCRLVNLGTVMFGSAGTVYNYTKPILCADYLQLHPKLKQRDKTPSLWLITNLYLLSFSSP